MTGAKRHGRGLGKLRARHSVPRRGVNLGAEGRAGARLEDPVGVVPAGVRRTALMVRRGYWGHIPALAGSTCNVAWTSFINATTTEWLKAGERRRW